MPRFASDSRLIFDFGMNNGDDTDFYLRQGFDVVALEANPALCDRAEKRFQCAIGEGRLKIVRAAIGKLIGEATFYVSLENDHWSSLDIGWAARDAGRYREIKVKCLTLSELFSEFGVPHYLKIDVEGTDQTVLEQLCGFDRLPLYVSVEDCRFGPRYMEILATCGYDGFKLLEQSRIPGMTQPKSHRTYSAGSSGPFGEDVPGEWLSYNEVVAVYSTTIRDRQGNRLAPRNQWWDIHCTNLGGSRNP